MLRPVQVWRWRVLALWLLRTVTYGCGHIHVIDPWWGRLAGFNKWITVFLSFLIHSVTDCKVRSLIIILFKYKINDIMLKDMQFNTYSQRTEVWSNILPHDIAQASHSCPFQEQAQRSVLWHHMLTTIPRSSSHPTPISSLIKQL